MHKKYTSAGSVHRTSAESSRIYSNDLYFAAVLHSQGYEVSVIRNERRRVTFVVPFSRGAHVVREAYRSGKVMLDMRSFRESLKHIRRLMDSEHCRTVDGEEQRSCPCPEVPPQEIFEASRMQLSRV